MWTSSLYYLQSNWADHGASQCLWGKPRIAQMPSMVVCTGIRCTMLIKITTQRWLNSFNSGNDSIKFILIESQGLTRISKECNFPASFWSLVLALWHAMHVWQNFVTLICIWGHQYHCLNLLEQHFKFMHSKILLCWCKLFWHKACRSTFLPGVTLTIHHSNSCFWGVTYEPYRLSWPQVYEANDWNFQADLFNHFETLLVNRPPYEQCPILCDWH